MVAPAEPQKNRLRMKPSNKFGIECFLQALLKAFTEPWFQDLVRHPLSWFSGTSPLSHTKSGRRLADLKTDSPEAGAPLFSFIFLAVFKFITLLALLFGEEKIYELRRSADYCSGRAVRKPDGSETSGPHSVDPEGDFGVVVFLLVRLVR